MNEGHILKHMIAHLSVATLLSEPVFNILCTAEGDSERGALLQQVSGSLDTRHVSCVSVSAAAPPAWLQTPFSRVYTTFPE